MTSTLPSTYDTFRTPTELHAHRFDGSVTNAQLLIDPLTPTIERDSDILGLLNDAMGKLEHLVGVPGETASTSHEHRLTSLETAAAATVTALAGKQSSAANLTAIAALASATDTVAYFTGAGTADVTPFTTLGRSIVGGANAAAVRGALALGSIALLAAPAGTVVGTTDTQTLTGKTIGLASTAFTGDMTLPTSALQPYVRQTAADVHLTNGSTSISSATAAFTSADVGRYFAVGVAGLAAGTTIVSQTGTAAVLSNAFTGTTTTTAVGSIGGTIQSGGVIRTASGLHITQTYTQTMAPDQADFVGTAILVNWNATLNDNIPGLGPQPQTGYFGPRGLIQVEGMATVGTNMGFDAGVFIGVNSQMGFRNAAGQAKTINPTWNFLANYIGIADGATVTLGANDTAAGASSYIDNALFLTVNGGAFDGMNGTPALGHTPYEHVGFMSAPYIAGNSHFRARVAFDVHDMPYGTTLDPSALLLGTLPFGAGADAPARQTSADATFTNGSANISSATAAFTAADVGKIVVPKDAGGTVLTGLPAGTRIKTVTDSTHAVMTNAFAGTTVTTAKMWIYATIIESNVGVRIPTLLGGVTNTGILNASSYVGSFSSGSLVISSQSDGLTAGHPAIQFFETGDTVPRLTIGRFLGAPIVSFSDGSDPASVAALVYTRVTVGTASLPQLTMTAAGLQASIIAATNTYTTSTTMTAPDIGALVNMDSTAPTTFTIPLNATVPVPIGSMVRVRMRNTGAVTVAPASGVTFNVPPTTDLTINQQYGVISFQKTSTDTWTCIASTETPTLVTGTGGPVLVYDGTAADGGIKFAVGLVFGTPSASVGVYHSATDTLPQGALTSFGTDVSLVFGAPNTASDFVLKRYPGGGGAEVTTGTLTLTSPIFNTGVSGSAIDLDGTLTANSDTKLASQKATKTYVDGQITAVVAGAPGALNTLNELATALGDDASFATTMTNSLALKAPLAGPSFTGTATFTGTLGADRISIVNTAAGATGQIVLAAGTFGGVADLSLIAIYKTAGDANPTIKLQDLAGGAGISFGVGGNTSTTDSGIDRSGAAGSPVLTVTGQMSMATGLTFPSGIDITISATTGTKIGQSTSRIGFFGATPVVQQTAATDLGTTLSNLGLRVAGTAYPITTSGAVTLTGAVAMNATTLATDTTTGLQIGTATSQKLGFFGATPVVQITGATDVLASLVTLGLRAASSNPPLNLGTGALTAGNLVASGSILSSSSSGGVGYATGAGGTVSQATSKSTGVTLNRLCGAITMNAAALNVGTTVSFVVTNSTVAATDTIVINHISGGTLGSYVINARAAAGSFTVDVRNIMTPTGGTFTAPTGSLSEALVLEFSVWKAVTA